MTASNQPATQQPALGFAITSLVTGIVGLLIVPIVLGPAAIIFGGLSMSKAREQGVSAVSGMAVAGLILGIIVVVLMVIRLATG